MAHTYPGKPSPAASSYPTVPPYQPHPPATTGLVMPSANPVVVFAQPQIRRCVFDPNVKTFNSTLIMNDLINAWKSKPNQVEDIECTSLAAALSALDARMTKIVLEMIIEYRQANQEEVQVMGKRDALPYSAKYNAQNKATSFDLFKMPATLVLILAEFIRLMNAHRK